MDYQWINLLCDIFLVTIQLTEHQTLAENPSCNGDGPCRCVMNDGSGTVDISSIGNFSGQARFANYLSYDGTRYVYNPCFPASLDQCQNAAVCKEANGKFIEQGSQDSAEWSFRGFYPIISYSSSNRKTEVQLICDVTFTNPQLTVIGELPDGTTGMMLWTKCACPGACGNVGPPSSSTSGLSLGSMMLILFFTFLGVYLTVGSIFNYTKAGKTGKEVIPNYETWSNLPGLILGGLRFTKNFICCQKDIKYESI